MKTLLNGFLLQEVYHCHFFKKCSDDWNAVAPSVLQLVSSSLQAPVQQQTFRVYMSAPNGMRQEVELFKQVIIFLPNLTCVHVSHRLMTLVSRTKAIISDLFDFLPSK